MIEIPLGKALIAVEVDYENKCKNCIFERFVIADCCDIQRHIHCNRGTIDRKDCKYVIFKLVDYSVEVIK